MQIGDIFIVSETGLRFRLNDIDWGWFKLGRDKQPEVYKWTRGKKDVFKNFTKIQDSPIKLEEGRVVQ